MWNGPPETFWRASLIRGGVSPVRELGPSHPELRGSGSRPPNFTPVAGRGAPLVLLGTGPATRPPHFSSETTFQHSIECWNVEKRNLRIEVREGARLPHLFFSKIRVSAQS